MDCGPLEVGEARRCIDGAIGGANVVGVPQRQATGLIIVIALDRQAVNRDAGGGSGVALGLYGGTGKTADWDVVAALARRYPGILLAGSLTAENVASAMQRVQPWGVDVSSGVEAAPGRKDHAKVQAFVQAAKHQIN